MGFDKGQIKDFVRRVKQEAGHGWSMLGPRYQRALIAERALYVMAAQHSPTIPTDALLELRNAMMEVAGVEDT